MIFGYILRKEGKLGAYAMKRVAAGTHLPTPWLFEPAKRPDDRADYYLEISRGGNFLEDFVSPMPHCLVVIPSCLPVVSTMTQ